MGDFAPSERAYTEWTSPCRVILSGWLNALAPSEHLDYVRMGGPSPSEQSAINDAMMAGLPGASSVSLSNDFARAEAEGCEQYTPEFLNTLTPNGMPPHELHLKRGALMIVLRNYAPRKALCNGTRVVVRGRWRRFLQVQIVSGPARGRIELLPRIVCDSSGDTELPFVLRRVQFPLRPAWAMTINKSQGQTTPGRLRIYLLIPVFTHGMLYVALSRAIAAARVRVLVLDYGDQQRKVATGSGGSASNYTLNLVGQSLLRGAVAEAHYEMMSDNISGTHQTDEDGSVAVISQEISDADPAARQEEQHRCATIEYDPRSHSERDACFVPTNPLTVDEWATFESGGPASSNPGVSGVTLPMLEERADDTLEFNSDDEEKANLELYQCE